MPKRPEGKGWKPVEFFGGPKDGDVTWYRGPDKGEPDTHVRFLDPSKDPAKGVKPGDMIHLYKFRRYANGVERYEYQGTQKAKA